MSTKGMYQKPIWSLFEVPNLYTKNFNGKKYSPVVSELVGKHNHHLFDNGDI